MGDAGQDSDADEQTGRALDFSRRIASLRLRGADRFDSVGLHYMEVLSSRVGTQRENVKRILEKKLEHALADFEQRFLQAQVDVKIAPALASPGHPHAATNLQQLVRHIAELSPLSSDGLLGDSAGPRTELRSVQHFRNTWSKLSANRKVAQALDQAPLNAGPINSHMLVLRSLALMRGISSDYLNRFVSYADTLLYLDECTKAQPPAKRMASNGRGGRRPGGRGSPR
jgi:hypothetical protein